MVERDDAMGEVKARHHEADVEVRDPCLRERAAPLRGAHAAVTDETTPLGGEGDHREGVEHLGGEGTEPLREGMPRRRRRRRRPTCNSFAAVVS